MSLSFTILLERILDRDLFTTQELSIHIFNSHIGSFKFME